MKSDYLNHAVVENARDMLVVTLESARRRVQEALKNVSKDVYNWEPISKSERSSDLHLPPEGKKVWRVFQKEGVWIYDYTLEPLAQPPFTTIAWIMNHIAQTGDMYLYCIKTEEPEGVDRSWDDLPVYSDHEQMVEYIYQVIDDTGEYLRSIPEADLTAALNQKTPAPWGEMRPTYKNIWGGIIGHTIEHATQISVLKHRIRFGY